MPRRRRPGRQRRGLKVSCEPAIDRTARSTTSDWLHAGRGAWPQTWWRQIARPRASDRQPAIPASDPMRTFASLLGRHFANVRIKGSLANIVASEALYLTFA